MREGGNGRHGADPPVPDDAALDVYSDAYSDMIMWLDSQTNVSVDARGEIGPVPLSTATWEEHHGASAERGEACKESG